MSENMLTEVQRQMSLGSIDVANPMPPHEVWSSFDRWKSRRFYSADIIQLKPTLKNIHQRIQSVRSCMIYIYTHDYHINLWNSVICLCYIFHFSSGWWFGTFFHILRIIIPTDYFFQKGKKPSTSHYSNVPFLSDAVQDPTFAFAGEPRCEGQPSPWVDFSHGRSHEKRRLGYGRL